MKLHKWRSIRNYNWVNLIQQWRIIQDAIIEKTLVPKIYFIQIPILKIKKVIVVIQI